MAEISTHVGMAVAELAIELLSLREKFRRWLNYFAKPILKKLRAPVELLPQGLFAF